MIIFLRISALVLIAMTSTLCAAVSFGDGFVLTTTDGLNYFTVNPGQANAGTTSTVQSESNNVFQLMTYFGTDTGGTVTYGALMSVQLPANKLWVTLNPASPFGLSMISLPYVRNNAPIPLEWETLYFVPVDGNIGDPISYGQQVYLATLGPDRSNNASYLHLDTTNQTATTVLTVFDLDTPTIPYDATPFIIQSASITPYTQPNSGTAVTLGADFNLTYFDGSTTYNFNMTPGAPNAGAISQGSATRYQLLAGDGTTGGNLPVFYGMPVTIMANSNYVTFNPAPGSIRNNTSSIGVWEELYFISVYGRNLDQLYSGDLLLLVRNGLINGQFNTEYVYIDYEGKVSTTQAPNSAVPFTLSTLPAGPGGI